MLLAAVGGWFFAKSMIETRGIAWAWFLHFLADFTVYVVLLLAGAFVGARIVKFLERHS